MSSYLTGPFSLEDISVDVAYGYLESLSSFNDTFYILDIKLYSDADKVTQVYARSDMLLPLAQPDETDDQKEVRALFHFKSLLASGMTIITEES